MGAAIGRALANMGSGFENAMRRLFGQIMGQRFLNRGELVDGDGGLREVTVEIESGRGEII